jgi:hypothetical protein
MFYPARDVANAAANWDATLPDRRPADVNGPIAQRRRTIDPCPDLDHAGSFYWIPSSAAVPSARS